MPPYVRKTIASPVGQLTLVAKASKLAAIIMQTEAPDRIKLPPMPEAPNDPVLRETERQLGEYFAGRRRRFDVALDFEGTEFQKTVWRALLDIPYGETCSYRDIAQRIGRPKAMRAVGAANGRNPISIISPCHRVIGASGELVGYAGGLPVKIKLLALERGAPL
jgi:methylated-DNA-[protein]-cysteine S-methyltransferase